MTVWKIGDKVYVRMVGSEIEYEIISIEESREPYYENAFATKKTKPKYAVEWCKCKAPDGTIREFAAHQLVQVTSPLGKGENLE